MDGQIDMTKLIVAFRNFFLQKRIKGKVFAVQAMEAYMGIGGAAPLIHVFGNGWR